MAHNTTLGQSVRYVSTKGYAKLVIVIGTPETVDANTEFGQQVPLSADQVNLLVISPTGNHSPRYQVPTQESVADNDDFSKGGYFTAL